MKYSVLCEIYMAGCNLESEESNTTTGRVYTLLTNVNVDGKTNTILIDPVANISGEDFDVSKTIPPEHHDDTTSDQLMKKTDENVSNL